jgi:hypothetical protein
MPEVWLIVTLCLVTESAAQHDQPDAGPKYQCADYRSEGSFATVEACHRHQQLLFSLLVRGRRVTALLCTALLSPEQANALPTLRAVLGAPA